MWYPAVIFNVNLVNLVTTLNYSISWVFNYLAHVHVQSAEGIVFRLDV